MKRRLPALIIVFAMLWVFSSCGNEKADIISDFTNLADKPVSSDNIVALSEFLDDKVDDVDKEVAEHMVGIYRDYLYDYILAQKEKTRLSEMEVYLDSDTGQIDEDKIKNSSHGEYYEKIRNAGLMLFKCEGGLTLKIDYGQLIERFGRFIPESMVQFYELEKNIAEKPATVNASLVISWQELLERAFIAEQIIAAHPDDHVINEDIRWLYKNYLGIILMGTTNTPIFDYVSKDFSQEALAAYRDFMKKEPGAVLSWVLGKYIEYLQGIGFRLDFNDAEMGRAFFDNCDYLIGEGEKRLIRQ